MAYAVLLALCLSVPARRLMRTVGRGIGQPEAFCAGTTAAYRKGNGTNSALTPLITPAPIGQPCLDLRSLHPIWRAGFDTCHGSDICDGNNWANLWTDAVAPEWYAAILFALSLLPMICNAVLAYKKHAAGLSISWKVVAVMALLWLPVPISKAVVSMPAQALRFTASEVAGSPSLFSVHPLSTRRLYLPRFFATQFYEMAAKDKVCGNNLVALNDLDLGAWIDKPGDVDCSDKKWIGAPDPSDDHENHDPCDRAGFIRYLWFEILWYFFACSFHCLCNLFNTWGYKKPFVHATYLATMPPHIGPPVAVDSA